MKSNASNETGGTAKKPILHPPSSITIANIKHKKVRSVIRILLLFCSPFFFKMVLEAIGDLVSLARMTKAQLDAVEVYEKGVKRMKAQLEALMISVDDWETFTRQGIASSHRDANLRQLETAIQEVNLAGQAASIPCKSWSQKVWRFMNGADLKGKLQVAEQGLSTALQLFDVSQGNQVLQNQANVKEMMNQQMDHTQLILKILSDVHKMHKKKPSGSMLLQAGTSLQVDPLLLDKSKFHCSFNEAKDGIGEGGFGTVFRGTYYGKPVAVKQLKTLSPIQLKNLTKKKIQKDQQRFRSEAELLLAHSDHAHILEVYACSTAFDIATQERPFLVLELMETNLFLALQNGLIQSPQHLAYLLKGVIGALESLHLRGTVHHDFKTANILLDASLRVAKLSDFGEAKVKGLLKSTHYNSTSRFVESRAGPASLSGTTVYLAPELLLREAQGSSRKGDIYALGVCLWECLTGDIPFADKLSMVDIQFYLFSRACEMKNKSSKSQRMLIVPKRPPADIENNEEEKDAWYLLQNYCKKCLNSNPKSRPNASKITLGFSIVKAPWNDEMYSGIASLFNSGEIILPLPIGISSSYYDSGKKQFGNTSRTAQSTNASSAPGVSAEKFDNKESGQPEIYDEENVPSKYHDIVSSNSTNGGEDTRPVKEESTDPPSDGLVVSSKRRIRIGIAVFVLVATIGIITGVMTASKSDTTLAPIPTSVAAPTTSSVRSPTPAPVPNPTRAPVTGTTRAPVLNSTPAPVPAPTQDPTLVPTPIPILTPTAAPTPPSVPDPTLAPIPAPTTAPTPAPVLVPTPIPHRCNTQQLGYDLDGEAAGDEFGYSISMSSDGNRLAVGATGNDGNGDNAGHVRVFDWSGSTWIQLGSDLEGEAARDYFGWSVSLSSDGNRLAVGAIYNGGNGIDAGHVRVFDWSGGTWIQLGPDLDGSAAGDLFGFSVSLSSDGNRLAVGAPYNNDNGSWAGHVRVFDWSGSTWIQLGSDVDGEAAYDQFGRSVSLSSNGNRLAVGAQYNNGNGGFAGHVRVLDWSGSTWVQLGSDLDGEAAANEFGVSASLSSDGNRLAVGAFGNDGNGIDAGHVRVFDWSGSTWIQVGSNLDGEAAGDLFGRSVSLSSDGNRLAVGATGNDGNGSWAGHVRVFDWSGSTWIQVGSDLDGEATFDFFGTSVSLSSDGSRLAVGATGNDGNGSNAGHVRAFELQDESCEA